MSWLQRLAAFSSGFNAAFALYAVHANQAGSHSLLVHIYPGLHCA